MTTVRVGLRPLPKRARLQRRSGTVWNELFISHCAFSNYPTKFAVITSIFKWEEEPNRVKGHSETEGFNRKDVANNSSDLAIDDCTC